MHTRYRSTGLSLVEVLVVIGIIGIVLALLLPAIQYAREASRRSQCTSNLRQLGIGLNSYHDSLKGLPPSVLWSPAGEPLAKGMLPVGIVDRVAFNYSPTQGPDRMYANWVVMLLPFVEEQSLYDMFDLKVPIHDAVNERARSTEFALMKCPADPNNAAENHFQRSDTPDQGYARSNYAMNGGTNQGCLMRISKRKKVIGGCKDGFQVDGTDLMTNNRKAWGSGIGGVNRSIEYREFQDGLSKTVALEEIRSGVSPLDRRGSWALGFVGSSITSMHGIYGDDCGPNNLNKESDDIQGCNALAKVKGIDWLVMEGMPCSSTTRPQREMSLQATSRSQHDGGVYVLMADGSAHFVANDVAPTIWHNMHKRDNQVPIELPF